MTSGSTEPTRFRLLGIVEVVGESGLLDLGRRRERCLLGLLLLTPNKAVPTARLADLLWDGEPPATAAAAVHTHVSRLRAAVDPDRAARYGVRLRHAGGQGYVAEVVADAVDVHRFTAVVDSARAVSDPARRACLLRSALKLWRGPLLQDCASDLLRARVGVELDELRLTATELAVDSELACGRHHDLIGELTRLTAEQPLRERFWGQLALGLYRGDRQAEALDALDRARVRLAEDLGIDPGLHLTRLREQILVRDPALLSATHAAEHQLPADIAEFTGREAELDLLCSPGVRTAPLIHAIIGMGGIGKTRLAVRAAHQLAVTFPDVHLWADLRGHDPDRPPTDPGAVLERFLRALGVPIHQIPGDFDARAALYRAKLADRRTLVLLDDAAGEDQVRPLLPGAPTCVVLITSRHSLTGLPGVRSQTLNVFSTDEAITLLSREVGSERIAAETTAAERVVRLCGHLPIAVALAARHLRNRPTWRLADAADRLADESRRLARLSTHSRAVRPTFHLSYRSLRLSDQRLFRLLALHPGPDVPAAAAAALAGTTTSAAESTLEVLYDEHLLFQPALGRYRMHDLVRLYATELTESHDSETDRQAAFVRLVEHYLSYAQQATRLVHPTETRRLRRRRPVERHGPGTVADALAWVDQEYANLHATVARAVDYGKDCARLAVGLVLALYRPLANRGLSSVRITLNLLAVKAAHDVGDRHGQAQALEDLGSLRGQVGMLADSITATRQALALWTELGDSNARQACLADLGNTYRQLGQFETAVDFLRRSLAIAEADGNEAGQASVLNYLGLTYQSMGQPDLAQGLHRDSYRRYRAAGNRLGWAIALANLGWAYQRAGDAGLAIGYHEQSLQEFRELGDLYNTAEQLWALGQAHHTLRRREQARANWHAAIGALRDIGLLDSGQADALMQQDVPETPEIIRLNT